MKNREQNRIGKIRMLTIGLVFSIVLCGFFYSRVVPSSFGSNFVTKATPTPKKKIQTRTKPRTTAKSTDFPHNAKQHSRLACGSCHKFPSANWKRVRKASEAFPDVTDYPKHES